MSPDIRPGARVMVPFDRHPRTWSPRDRLLAFLPLDGATDDTDRIDERYAEHRMFVALGSIGCHRS